MRIDTVLGLVVRWSRLHGEFVDCSDIPRRVLVSMVAKGLIVQGPNRCYALTDEGREAYNAGSRRMPNTSDWIDEARSGIRECRSPVSGHRVTRETTIRSAVVPRVSTPRDRDTPEDLLQRYEAAISERDYLCDLFGVSVSDLVAAFDDGRVRFCRGGHLGLFARARSGRLFPRCEICRSKR